MDKEHVITDDEIVIVKDLIKDCVDSYQAKAENVTDKEWLKDVFVSKINDITEEKALADAETIVNTIHSFSGNLQELQQAEQNGISKENWLSNCIQQDIGECVSVEQGEDLTLFDDSLYLQNMDFAGQPVDDLTVVDADGETEEYSSYRLKEVALDIGKNASAIGIQNAASTAGTLLVAKVMEGEQIAPNQIIQEALKSGVDSSMQVVASGALKIASENELLQNLPKNTPAEVVAGISSVGVESTKILAHVASGEISFTKGIEQFGRLGVSVVKNFWTIAKNISVKDVVTTYLPFLGPQFAVISQVVGTVTAFMGGTEFGKSIVKTKEKVANVAKTVAKTAVQGLRKAKQFVSNGLKKTRKLVSKIFG